MKLLVCLCLLLPLCACTPERQQRVPSISGIVLANGRAAAGIKVLITSTENSCSEPLAVMTTDAQGAFTYEGLREWGLGRIFVSPEQTHSICLQSGGGSPTLAMSRRLYGAHSHEEVRCVSGPDATTTKCAIYQPAQ